MNDKHREEFEKENGLLLEAKDMVDYLGRYSIFLEKKLE